jgi:hypothetical protein
MTSISSFLLVKYFLENTDIKIFQVHFRSTKICENPQECNFTLEKKGKKSNENWGEKSMCLYFYLHFWLGK